MRTDATVVWSFSFYSHPFKGKQPCQYEGKCYFGYPRNHFTFAKPSQRVHSLSDCSNIPCILRMTFDCPSVASLGGIYSGGRDVCFICLQFVSKARLCGINSSLGVMDSYSGGPVSNSLFPFFMGKGWSWRQRRLWSSGTPGKCSSCLNLHLRSCWCSCERHLNRWCTTKAISGRLGLFPLLTFPLGPYFFIQAQVV